MAGHQLNSVLAFIRSLAGTTRSDDATDADLLRRIAAVQDETAFVAVLQRHGPLVFAVCRRVLADVHDAEDAFQATFLVLARRAASIRRGASLASWLHGVAYRVALEARTRAARRHRHERATATLPRDSTLDPSGWAEVRPLLDEALRQLPEKYRTPLVLHYLEGKTKQETARQLGWAEGTVSGRLDRARKLLRRLLARRGVSVPAGSLAAMLSAQASSSALSPWLQDEALRVGLSVAAGQAASAAGTEVASLAASALRSLVAARMKAGASLCILAGLLATGAGLVAHYYPVSPQEELAIAQVLPADRVALAPEAPPPEEPDEDTEPGLKDRAVDQLQAVTPDRWVESWKADLDVTEQSTSAVLGRLARELGLTIEATPAQRETLGRLVSLKLRGRSRLELVEELCRRVNLYPIYPDDVTRPDSDSQVIRLNEGPRPWPVTFAGPFRVTVEGLHQTLPDMTGELRLRFLAVRLPPAVGLPLHSDQPIRVKRVAGTKEQDFLDPTKKPSWTGTEAYTAFDVTEYIPLKGLRRDVPAIRSVEGSIRVPVASRIEVLRFQDLRAGASQKAGAVQVTLRSIKPQKFFFNGERERLDFDFRFCNTGLYRLAFVAYDAEGKLLRTVWSSGAKVTKEQGYHVVGYASVTAAITAKWLAEEQHLDYSFRLENVRLPAAPAED